MIFENQRNLRKLKFSNSFKTKSFEDFGLLSEDFQNLENLAFSNYLFLIRRHKIK